MSGWFGVAGFSVIILWSAMYFIYDNPTTLAAPAYTCITLTLITPLLLAWSAASYLAHQTRLGSALLAFGLPCFLGIVVLLVMFSDDIASLPRANLPRASLPPRKTT